jgi:uncharacterized surface protein with fasciclin (FAS1) repeats
MQLNNIRNKFDDEYNLWSRKILINAAKSLKRLNHNLRALSARIFVIILILVIAISSLVAYQWLLPTQDPPDDEQPTPTPSTQLKDIFDTLNSDNRFSIFVDVLQNSSIKTILKSPGPFTVFAPTDDAFNAIPISVLNYIKNNITLLNETLNYHIIPKKLDIDQVINETILFTIQGTPLVITTTNDILVNNAKIVQSNINCTNGVIHVLDKMLQIEPLTLSSIEIREYEGKNLSSIDDFRENSILGPQFINISTYQLEIAGHVRNPINYTYQEVISKYQKYQKVVTLNCIEGWSVTILWEGFLLRDLLQEADVISGAPKVVIFYAYDGYSTSLPLNYLLNNDILIAYKMNGVVIPPERGYPFQLISESKYGYKWIKWITRIEISENISYEGFWESRGYPNNGDLPGS